MTAKRPWSNVFEFLVTLQALGRAGGWVKFHNGCIRRPKPGVHSFTGDRADLCDCPASAGLGVELGGVDEMWQALAFDRFGYDDAYDLLGEIVNAADAERDYSMALRDTMLELLGVGR